jgi:xanthine dehydrogenase YagS FAD-binding subunit
MNRFDYARAENLAHATRIAADAMADSSTSVARARFLAGGTNIVDLMKEDVERPQVLVDLNRLPLKAIEDTDGGGLRLGALATNAETARHPAVMQRYPLLASAILAGASPQLRNAATNGGNLNQRTRCYYFYDTAAACNKRGPGSGCGAIGGVTRIHAILGASEQCIATHPSDMCVALAALDAQVKVRGPDGERTIPFADYHRLPGDEAWRDNTLAPAEVVTAIELPAGHFSTHYTYLKLRDRLSYAFALVSVAVALSIDEAGVVSDARIALGGVAHKPWRVPAAEALLRGAAPSPELFGQVAERILEGAVGQGANDFKIELARRAIVRALKQAAAGRPQSQSDKRIA